MTHDAKLGQIIDNPNAARDAIHIAIAPVTADTRLHPGQRVGLIGDGDKVAIVPQSIGIVDPFLTGPVNAGERFWMFLYQNTITSLRHAWRPATTIASPEIRRTASTTTAGNSGAIGRL
jgi:hypothetical protein